MVSYIENTNDGALQSLLKEDFLCYNKAKDADITDDLSKGQLKELKALSEEEENKDTHSPDEFKIATRQWLAK